MKLRFSCVVLSLAIFGGGVVVAQQMPNPTADAVWNYIQSQDYAKNWQLMPGTTKMHKGTSPVHGAILTTYVNPTAYQALEAKESTLPPGSILVKENYSPKKTLKAYTVMYKSEGYNPQNGNWFWLKRTAAGKNAKAGKVAGCQNCHSKAKAHDFVFAPGK